MENDRKPREVRGDEISQAEYDNQIAWTEAFAREQKERKRLRQLMKEYPDEVEATTLAAQDARIKELERLLKRMVDDADDLARSFGLDRIHEAENSLIADARAALKGPLT